MSDKYDHAIEYLTANPGEIRDAWADPYVHEAGCLFVYAFRGDSKHIPIDCGCLTLIKMGRNEAETPELTDAIMRDDRIPIRSEAITIESLPVFAEWQRIIDAELGSNGGGDE